MTDQECIAQLRGVRMFCSVQQVLAVDRAVALLQEKVKENAETPLP